jgi:putative transposase
MRYAASEKLEIIRTVETSPLPVRRTLAQIGIPKSTFYAWLDRYAAGGLDALEDRKAKPKRVWNRIPDQVRQKVIACALDQPELSPGKWRSPSPIASERSSRKPASIGC